jgi:hypothetical protein
MKIGWKNIDLVHVAEVRDLMQVLVNTVVNLRFP